MNDVVIRVENLSKLYKIGARQQGYQTLGKQLLIAAAEKKRKGVAGTHQRFDKYDTR